MMYFHQTVYVLIKKRKFSIHELIRIASRLKKQNKKSFLPSMVVGILKAIQEEPIGKYLFSKKLNCLITSYQFTNILIYQI